MDFDSILLTPDEEEITTGDGFNTVEDGDYKSSSFEWFSKNDEGKPILVANPNGQLVVRGNFDNGAPMSFELHELPLLAKAFNVKPSDIPSIPNLNEPTKISAYLETIETLCNAQEKEVFYKVNGGWVNEIKGMELSGEHDFIFHSFTPQFLDENGLPFYKESQWEGDPYFYVNFMVVDGPYKNVIFSEPLNYSCHANGDTFEWNKKKNGQFTNNAKRFAWLLRVTKSPNAPKVKINPNNILIAWAAQALLPERPVLRGPRITPSNSQSKKLNKAKLNWMDVVEAGYTYQMDDSEIFSAKETEVHSGEDNKAKDILIEVFDILAGKPIIVPGSNYELNSDGVNIARKYISPVKKEGKVKAGNIAELGFDEIQAIMNYIVGQEDNDRIKELNSELAELGLGFTTPSEPEPETPF